MRSSKIRFDVPDAGLPVPGVRYLMSGIGATAAGVVLGLVCLSGAYGQETQGQEIQPEKAHPQVCPDPPPQTSGSHGFRRVGETIDIPINVADCQPLAFVLRWSNGRSNGTMLVVTFLDSTNQPIHSRSLSGFLTGSFEFPFASLDPQPWFAKGSMVAVPTTIVIQAKPPFYPPANISYTVTRIGARVRPRPQLPVQAAVQPAASSKSEPVSSRTAILDDRMAMKLRTSEGRLLWHGQSSWRSAPEELVRYKLKELTLPEPREIEINGRRETVEVAYRLTIAGGELRSSQSGTVRMPALSKFGLIWLDDAALPAFSLNSQEISTLIYDPSVLREGAEISVSNTSGGDIHSMVDRLKYQSNIQSPTSHLKNHNKSNTQASMSGAGQEGSGVVAIRSGVRVIGATRMPLVQIELNTNRPFPARDSALQMQIGKRFFVNELTGDHTGRALTLTLTQEMFAELKQGAEIIVFFDKPDRSGFAGQDIWHFGRLDKSLRQ